MAEDERPWWLEIADKERREIGDEEGSAIMNAWTAMLRGDLLPLAEYLRAGYPLNYMVRRELVQAIEGQLGQGLYRMQLVKNRRGPGDTFTSLSKQARMLRIGQYIEEQLPDLNDDVEAAVSAAGAKFDLGRSTIMKAWSYYQQWKDKVEASAAEWRESKQIEK